MDSLYRAPCLWWRVTSVAANCILATSLGLCYLQKSPKLQNLLQNKKEIVTDTMKTTRFTFQYDMQDSRDIFYMNRELWDMRSKITRPSIKETCSHHSNITSGYQGRGGRLWNSSSQWVCRGFTLVPACQQMSQLYSPRAFSHPPFAAACLCPDIYQIGLSEVNPPAANVSRVECTSHSCTWIWEIKTALALCATRADLFILQFPVVGLRRSSGNI